MIKENTKKTLVWLYPTAAEWRFVPKTRIGFVVPHLSPAGVRSLLYTLEKKQLILSQRINGELSYGLTTIGKATIETEIPILKGDQQANTEWSLLVFQQAPASDRNFRYLRQLLLANHWIALSRGVFIVAGEPTLPLQQTIQKLYPQAVMIAGVNKWHWGDMRLVIGQSTAANQVSDIYSGISREIDRLIDQFLGEKNLDDQAKKEIVSTFDRLYTTLEQDFPLAAGDSRSLTIGKELLGRLQLLG